MSDETAVRRKSDRLHTNLLGLIAVVAVAWLLRATASVTFPFFLGLLLAALVYPVQRLVVRRVPSWLKGLGTIAALFAVLLPVTAVGAFLWFSLSMVAEKAPPYEEIYSSAEQWAQKLGVTIPAALEPEGGDSGSPSPSGSDASASGASSGLLSKLGSVAMGTLATLVHVLTIAGLAFFFTLLMLLEAKGARQRLAAACGPRASEALDAADSTIQKIREYLWVRTIVSILSGILAGLWFLVIGVDFWYLWGFLFFALNYVPFVGSLLAGIPPTILAFATSGLTTALLAAAGTILTENIMGNFVGPKLQGDRLAISPVVLLFALAFFGWAWGWPGLLLAVPMTAALVVCLAHIDRMKTAALLLSDAGSREELERQTHGG